MRRGSRAAIAVLVGAMAVTACTPATSTPPATVTPTMVDPDLLAVLPSDVDGQALRPDAETAADIAGTGDLAADIEAIAVGLYIQPGSSTADDLAIVNVVRLRPGVFGDGWYRSWQSTYDDGACQVAGGVAPGSVESVIAGHETHIGTCQGGVHTYHVHLLEPDRVISITAAGEGRFGERVVAGLTE